MTNAQADAAEAASAEEGTSAEIRVRTDEPRGFVVAEALAIAPSALRQARAQAARLQCASDAPKPTASLGSAKPL